MDRYQEYPGLAAELAEAAVAGPPGELLAAMAAPVPTPAAAITTAPARITVCLRVIMISVSSRFRDFGQPPVMRRARLSACPATCLAAGPRRAAPRRARPQSRWPGARRRPGGAS